MRSRGRSHGNVQASKSFIEAAEKNILRQKLLVKSLRSKGRPTAEALATLRTYEETLYQLRNHAKLMSELMGDLPGPEPQKG